MDRPLHRFTVTGDDIGLTTKVTLDNVELKGVTRLILDVDPNNRHEPTRLELEFIPGSIKVEASGVVTISGRGL